MVQLLSGLITYLLMAAYCRKHYNEPVSVVRLRQIRIEIRNELRKSDSEITLMVVKELTEKILYAKN